MKMLSKETIEECRKNKMIRELKINSLKFAIEKSEEMISESRLNEAELIFLRRKIASSRQELELLYLLSEKE
tara:strand:+ start:440 stop:655 length:216 start_codon:yes stop_codon:yes gene_type:complete